VAAAPKTMPGTAFFVPLSGDGRLGADHQLQVYKWTERSGRFTPMIRGRPFPGDLGTHREGLDADDLDPAGLYLGTTTGQLLWSRDGGARWQELPYRFPAIHSVRVAAPSA